MKLDTTAMIVLVSIITVNALISGGGPIATSILFGSLAIVGALKQIRITLEGKTHNE
jgi:tetrahydrodipicolinate N-succinyltransferase